MSKKVFRTIGKVAAIVGEVAMVATGVGAVLGGTMMLAIGGASIAASTIASAAGLVSVGASLLGKPKAPKIGASNEDRLNASINVRRSRVMAFGRTAFDTDLRDQEFTGADKEYLHRFLVCAAHKVNAIEEIWFDDKMAWSVSGGVTSSFSGYLTVTPVLEGGAGNAINISSRMGSSRRFTGCAYVYLRFKLTGNSKKTESPFAQQVPTRVTIVGEGMPCYDPRQDSTQPGGSGTHRAGDQTTWTWGEHARNPACQFGTWMLGWRIQNPQSLTWKLSVGCGIPAERIDWPAIMEGANLCDEAVALAAGGTEPRYRGDGLFDEDDGPVSIVDAFKACMNADVDDQDGLIRLTVFHNDLATPDADFTEADVQGDYVWLQTQAPNESFNVVRGSYVEPSSLYQPAPYQEASVPPRAGIDRVHPADFGHVQSRGQAERLAKQRLQRQLYGGEFRTTFLASGWKVQKNSVVRLSFAPEGWVNKLFRVAEYEVRQDGLVPMVLREEHADIYAWDAADSPAVVLAEPTEYLPGDAPIPQFLGTIEEGADVTGNHTSADTANVNGRPSTEVTGAIDAHTDEIAQLDADMAEAEGRMAQAETDIADLVATYGNTASSATNAAAAEAAKVAALDAQAAAEAAKLDSDAARDGALLSEQAAQLAETNATQQASNAAGSAVSASGSANLAQAEADDAETWAGVAQTHFISARLASALLFPERYVTGNEQHFFNGRGGNPSAVTPALSNATITGFGPVYEAVGTKQWAHSGVLPPVPDRIYEAELEVEVTASTGTTQFVRVCLDSLTDAFGALGAIQTRLVAPAVGVHTLTVRGSSSADVANAIQAWFSTPVWIRPFAESGAGDGSITARFKRLAVRDITGEIEAGIAAEAAVTASESAAVSETNAGISAAASEAHKVSAEAAAASATEAAQKALATSMPERYVTGSETNFTTAIGGNPDTVATADDNATLSGWGPVYQVSADQSVWAQKNLFTPFAGRVYEVEVEAECTAVNTTGGVPILEAGWWGLTSAYAHTSGQVSVASLTATGTYSATLRVSNVADAAHGIAAWDPSAVHLRPGGRLRLQGGTATIKFKSLSVRDITSRINSEIAAEAAATERSLAEAEANAAAASALAAQTAATNAQTHAGSAETFSLASSQSAADAENAKDMAILAQTASATSATNAGNSATAAAGSASLASTQASNSGASASASAASALEAKSNAKARGLTPNGGFDNGLAGFWRFADLSGDLTAYADLVTSEFGRSNLIRSMSGGVQLNVYGEKVGVQPGRKYVVRAGIWKVAATAAGVGFAYYDAAGTYLGGTSAASTASGVWQDYATAALTLADMPANTAFVAPRAVLNTNADPNRVWLDYLFLEDVTESSAAATSATASAASAASADADAATATAQANLAATYRTQAQTAQGASEDAQAASEAARDTATSQATIATNEAATATAQAATATSQANLAATHRSAAEVAEDGAVAAKNDAATQAGISTAQAVIATDKAAAATNQANLAATHRSAAEAAEDGAVAAKNDATTQAGISTAQAVVATDKAAAATTSANLSASLAAGGVLKNGSFADYPATPGLPANWTQVEGAAPTRVTGQISPYAMRLVGGAGAGSRVRQAVGSASQAVCHQNQWWVIEAQVRLASGALTGGGILMQTLNINGVNVGVILAINFATDADSTGVAPGAGVAGRTYRFARMVKITQAAAARFLIDPAAHFASFGSIAAANTLDFQMVSARPATAAEIEIQTTLPTLSASVTTHASALATLDSQYASLEDEVTAQGLTVSQQQVAINGMAGRWAVAIDVNGRVVGRVKLDGTGQTSSFDVEADAFRITKPGGGERFEFTDGNGRTYDSAGTLRVRWGVWS